MFSRKESRQLREQFWIAFGKSYPRRWRLYRTGITGVDLKFHFDLKKAMVCLDVEGTDPKRINDIWDRLISLQTILRSEYLTDAIYDPEHLLEIDKRIKRIYVKKEGVCIHDKNTWQEAMLFLSDKMSILEDFVLEYSEIIDP
ncbi:DUF4268 domain-containing protein [Muriicola marianensis]|uniref:DUF4268 domain-containing protein n=1 Tax=Muriicola marianensis TaxID=1324801 RepID=A0ABQ1QPQ1_9FLAO|nr:DUF4268 domain-containing protein [Muriicola marianensis]GGD36911.1 hypothetical protein GCM10011361_00030 [Muriicola marianensis]